MRCLLVILSPSLPLFLSFSFHHNNNMHTILRGQIWLNLIFVFFYIICLLINTRRYTYLFIYWIYLDNIQWRSMGEIKIIIKTKYTEWIQIEKLPSTLCMCIIYTTRTAFTVYLIYEEFHHCRRDLFIYFLSFNQNHLFMAVNKQ